MSVGLEPDSFRDEVFVKRFPVHRACRDGDVGALVSLLQQLSNQAHLTAEDSCYGWTPLHWAAHCGQLECVVRLVQMGCEVNSVTSRFNQTPTHIAAFGGHRHCVVWLTQAGADVNRQDFVGEAPIHKAARSGSMECIQVLLIAGAHPHLRNASGQTAADLAHAHGFLGCSHLIADDCKLQPSGLNKSGEMKGDPVCGQALHSRKRLFSALDGGHAKKTRTAESVHIHSSGGEVVESMNMESEQDLSSDRETKPTTSSHRPSPILPYTDQEPVRSLSSWSPPPADMCGSLHLAGSPGSCVSHQPDCWGSTGADCGSFLLYGHYHGFGDTAEELGDSSSIPAEHRYQQAAGSGIHLYHGS
ncbi:ankyrin repeat domain-containing protein 10-like [Betta splendens]|uniref:Ankyrin repeat domain-containing protein 10-like n=1 Tax=Betta splendens TaxID=158456 RepID=A0A6P7LWR3_BETSP|nr:ankyrin repeat domain-containing protein 10-like [Betta splendens]